MARIPRIMTDLHYISDKIAENSRNISGRTDHLNPPEETHTPKIEPLVQNQGAVAENAAALPPEPDLQEEITSSQEIRHLDMCTTEYNNMRCALKERMASLSARLKSRKKQLDAEIASLNPTLAEIERLVQKLSDADFSKAHFDHLDECNEARVALEQIQMQYAKLRAASEDVLPEKKEPVASQTPVSGDFFALMLKSLSFWQLSRLGFGLGFAYILALLLMGFFLAIAIIGALKGYF